MLYNKYRPQTFAEVIGQDAAVSILCAAASSQHPPHAYLLCGPRGTGKTTLARLVAAALDADLHERNAADYRGIDSVRDTIQASRFAPMFGKRKVELFDEAHALTNDAQNALLKLVEEPPPHVVIILTTTAPDSILPTVISRCLRCDLKPISASVLVPQLQRIAEAEGYSIAESTLTLIARSSGGDFRNALGELEKAGLAPGVRAVTPRQKPSKKMAQMPVGRSSGRPPSEPMVRSAVETVLADGHNHSFTEIRKEAARRKVKDRDTVRKTVRQMQGEGVIEIDESKRGRSWTVWKTS